MQLTKHLAGLLAATALLCGCSPSPTWTDYTYKEHHFAVAFTAPPKTGGRDQSFLVEEGDGTVDFGVTAACGIAPGTSPDQTMSNAIDATRRNGTVRSLTYTALGQTMGREMLVDRAGATTVRQRLFVHAGCLYVVFATAAGGPDDESVMHFLDSFRLLDG